MQQRLQKLISTAGIASRRHAEELITAGLVQVNGKVVDALGAKADPAVDKIKVKGRLINRFLEQHLNIYILLNKPRGYLTSMADPEGRPLVTELIPPTLGRLHPVGRLDFNTEGLLLLTNDGEFTNIVTAARNQIRKVYRVKVKGMPTDNAVERLRRGIAIGDEGERTAPAEVRQLRSTESNGWFEVILHQGRNQQIRRMFDAIGHSVTKLKRTHIGELDDRFLNTGQWRELSPIEVRRLKNAKRADAPAKNPRARDTARPRKNVRAQKSASPRPPKRPSS
ncbi:MAG: rRNA synthase [Blastocatellia bacterium]|jgi:23S rRNA pseudouridine2605 synthase|nr:rRNA synthase [Blastocatellia bacterium]